MVRMLDQLQNRKKTLHLTYIVRISERGIYQNNGYIVRDKNNIF
jgi:hypothetical protein